MFLFSFCVLLSFHDAPHIRRTTTHIQPRYTQLRTQIYGHVYANAHVHAHFFFLFFFFFFFFCRTQIYVMYMYNVCKTCKSSPRFFFLFSFFPFFFFISGISLRVLSSTTAKLSNVTLKINSRCNTDHNFYRFQKISD